MQGPLSRSEGGIGEEEVYLRGGWTGGTKSREMASRKHTV